MNNQTKSKVWVITYLLLVIIMLGSIARLVIHIDPFFHYHKPLVDEYSYTIDNQRSQNDGIAKNFEYDALITGTSMIDNFKTSEMDEIFGVHSIKLPYSGGTYKEINDNVVNAIKHNKNLRVVIRGLDIVKIIEDKENMRTDLGDYPTYLFDDNVFNDVKYIFNRDVIFSRVYPMIYASNKDDFEPRTTTFDEYSNWMSKCSFGINTVNPQRVSRSKTAEPVHLSEEQKEILLENVRQNAASVAEDYPEIQFYYFFTPYSAIWWLRYANNGAIYTQVEAERLVIEELLKYDNIKLFSFSNITEITTDINNYKDGTHYGEWINSLMLRYMHDGKYQLTADNYEEYLEKELDLYLTFDYESLNFQPDYENDYYAAALWNEEIKGIKPLDIDIDFLNKIKSSHAILSMDEENKIVAECTGYLGRSSDGDINVEKYMRDVDYVGFEFTLDITEYDYIVFYGQKTNEQGQPTVYIYDESGAKVAECIKAYQDIDEDIHQYLIDVSTLSGKMRIIFNGGYTDNTGNPDSGFIFSNITFY